METILKGKGPRKTFFNNKVLKAQEQAVPMHQKSSQWWRRSVWLDRELLHSGRKREFMRSVRRSRQLKTAVKMCRQKIRRA